MHFSSIAVPLVAMAAAVQGQTVKVFSDAKCTKQIQSIQLKGNGEFQCVNIQSASAKGVIFSNQGFNSPYRAFNVWDAQYCAGDAAGGTIQQLNTCISATDFGYYTWKSVHISPRNPSRPPLP